MSTERRSNTERTRRTTGALVSGARLLFARRGYAGVGLAEVAEEAGVTKGALYHHFGSKAGLFRAVVEQVQQDVGERVAAAAEKEADPWSRLTAGCGEFLAAASDPEVQRIMLVDGPAVLGWAEWRRMDEAASARHLVEALADLVGSGVVAPQPVEPLARLLSGAMNEAALWLARSESPEADLADTVEALSRLLESLRAGA
ncbi:TetR/AcrR family transcriptional regulator [Actinorugispora endophytica]|uniref:TetR family transcriptional regulator n=1 Tax=Actinorugispora endophytica TaxID=1605990 RepID=A0A4R6UYD5_9ACTN|nr:TetR/AcrR family transcriptional regulator [Actinorugispora endophytica]TDQ52512.1 TetR family transcriptional regulator [Actinorugispora endophytica]